MSKPEILVCDDHGARARQWKDSIERIPEVSETFDVVCPEVEEFADIFRSLRDRQTAARLSAPPVRSNPHIERLDAAAAVIVDFDLTPSEYDAIEAGEDWVHELAGSFGNVFAYLARVFSGVACTVVVNQDFPSSTFDLTMNRFQFSAADLNVSAPDLGNRGLWSGDPDVWAGSAVFRPWHWPNLPELINRMRTLSEQVDLEADVFETLGLDGPDVMQAFASNQLEPLGLTSFDKPTVSFKDLAHNERYGKLPTDHFTSEDQTKLVAVSAVIKWLDRTVLAGQNVLIDAPHLVTRRPGLTTRPTEEWATIAQLQGTDAARRLLDSCDISGAFSVASEWLGRPVWHWQRIPIVSSKPVDTVFCEDTSAFARFDDAVDFESSVPGPVRQRYIKDLDEEEVGMPIAYDPELRLL